MSKDPVRLAVAAKTALAAQPAEKVLPAEALVDPFVDTWLAHFGCSGVSGTTASDTAFQHLFHITRNSNYNVVVYEAATAADGSIADAAKAINAYWFDIDPAYIKKHKKAVLDKHCRTELSYIDRTMAYGASTKKEGDVIVVSLVAMPKKKITMVKTPEGLWRAVTDINGVPCYLMKIYINTKTGWTGPKVQFVLIFGEAVDGGALQEERIKP